jgi:hypothetical protein
VSGRPNGGDVSYFKNSSGLNAHYTLPMLAADYKELREAVDGR